MTAYQFVPDGVTVPLLEAEFPGLIVPRLVAAPQVLPFEVQVVPQTVVPAGHTHEKPEQMPPGEGGVQAVPAGCGTSAGHATLAPLHDWLVSHTPEAV